MTRTESGQIKRLQALADRVRRESRAGRLLRLDAVWDGTEEEFAALSAEPCAGAVSDLAHICEGDSTFLFSNLHMTRPYAEAAARAAASAPEPMIAAAVRSDSATYPRPTPIAAFCARPYHLSPEEVTAAIARMAADEEYADIRPVQASNGDRFLISLRHINEVQGQAMAEWLAVRRFDNP